MHYTAIRSIENASWPVCDIDNDKSEEWWMNSLPQIDLDHKTILLTGGTGSFGQAFTRRIIQDWPTATVRIYSRDELKQSEMHDEFDSRQLRFMVGDVRDRYRLARAANGAHVIVHAAALKQVPICEYNPFEAVQTNVIGTQNVVDASIDCGVERVVGISTDKAVNPVNLYGATKLCAEKIMIQGNAYAAQSGTIISCVRYGNVVGSRGSVVHAFRSQQQHGELTITDLRMTRFWITLDQAIDLVLHTLRTQRGGEIMVPQIPSIRIADLAEAIAPGHPTKVVGIRPGEKLHEILLTADEARHSLAGPGFFMILPEHPWWSGSFEAEQGEQLPEGFVYSSNGNEAWLDVETLRAMLQ